MAICSKTPIPQIEGVFIKGQIDIWPFRSILMVMPIPKAMTKIRDKRIRNVRKTFIDLIVSLTKSKCKRKTRMAGLFNKRESLAFFVASAGSADSMDIIVIGIRQVKVNNMADIGNIKASGSHIGSDENLNSIGLK